MANNLLVLLLGSSVLTIVNCDGDHYHGQANCPWGYIRNGPYCVDFNECYDRRRCGGAFCVNTIGSYRCECGPGYTFSGNTCVDVNECLNTNICGRARCVNTLGSYRCECPDGYSQSGNTCVDVDECLNPKNCPANSNCVNTAGSYRCECLRGFTPSGYSCVDINECQSNPCEQICTNTVGGYICGCNQGYIPSTVTFGKCVQPVQCNPGYRPSTSNQGQCEDINECTSNPCEHVCTNSVGSYTCSCNTGYAPSTADFRKCVTTVQCKQGYRPSTSSPGQCEDIDECQEKNPCEQTCKNNDGGYRCSCNEGYDVSSNDFHKCVKMKMCSATIDLILVIDSSASLGPNNNKLQLEYASDIVKHFYIGPDKAKIAALLFGNNPKKLFDLKDYSTTDEVAQRILNAGYLREQSTGTDKALKFITTDDMFSAQSGGRPGVRSAVLVLTDGKSTNAAQTKNEAKSLKSGGVEIYSIGIGKEVDGDELKAIASSDNNVYTVPDFESLDYLEENLSRTLCQVS